MSNLNKSEQPLISIRNLKKYFHVSGGTLKAVDGLTFDIYKGETIGLVGESGCGKSTAGRTILRMYEPTSGEVLFEGTDIFKLSKGELNKMRSKMQMVFQDPYSSLNPRMTVEDIIGEPLDVMGNYKTSERRKRIEELVKMVGLNVDHLSRFPHEFSGGQRQRIGIARALAINPSFIVCDEPISSLDVSIQAQVVNLLKELQEELGLTYLFIAHDLSMVKYISHRIMVMYLGHMAEFADSEELNNNPLHPYTQALLSAVPIPDPDEANKKERIILSGDLPSPINPPKGCPFCTRCPKAFDKCNNEKPEFREVKPGHFVACHLC